MANYRITGDLSDKKVCLECGSVMYGGRPDRKYCCESCKNRYNNKRAQGIRNLKLRIRNSLDRNYDILSVLVRNNVTHVDRAELAMKGFRPEFVTSHTRTPRHDCCCCYDIAYCLTPTRLINLRRLSLAPESPRKRPLKGQE
ncbi:MAG: hypothetical protein ACI3ZC_06995 [Candidatus Cryptobacteroides sp.]